MHTDVQKREILFILPAIDFDLAGSVGYIDPGH
jgi:hypothetical protein